jgi:hypothetical protein
MILKTSQDVGTRVVLESLAKLDTSKTERLDIERLDIDSLRSYDLRPALFPMKHLRSITLHSRGGSSILTNALDPSASPTGTIVCPNLEELIIKHRNTPSIKNVIGMAAARASREAKLNLVRIISQYQFVQADVLELEKHVLCVECATKVDEAGGGDSDGEED